MAEKMQASREQPPPALADVRRGRGMLDLAAVGLILLVTLPWWLSTRGAFIPYDDPAYVTANADVLSGLSAASISAAFTHAWAAFWLPVTFISLMLDVSLWGSGDMNRLAAGMHATNVLLHVANAVLLYWFLSRATAPAGLPEAEAPSNRFRSLFATLLFAMHPLRVESVSWITERKDVLAGFFGLLAMLAYLQFVRGAKRPTRFGAYVVVCICFALSLMSKPMLVTLPALLLLIDAWPLERFGFGRPGWLRRAGMLVVEKLPLFAITAAISIITVIIQRQIGALVQLEKQSLLARVQNALVAYALYLRDHIYFHDLSLYYPLRTVTGGEAAPGALILVMITVAAIFLARNAPRHGRPALIGWLWFLGTLVPMIGLVQSGEQGRADRFTYFPSIGLAIGFAWLWPGDKLKELWQRKAALAAGAGVVLVLTVYTTLRVALWNDPLALFLDGIAHTEKNAKLEYFVGVLLEQYHRPDDAITYYRRAVFDSEGFPQAYLKLGTLLVERGQEEEGFLALDVARRMKPDDPSSEKAYQELRDLAAKRAATRSK